MSSREQATPRPAGGQGVEEDVGASHETASTGPGGGSSEAPGSSGSPEASPEPSQASDGPGGHAGPPPGEDPASAGGGGDAAVAPPTYQDLLADRERLEAELGEAHDRSLRMTAEVENIRRRAERDLENAHKFGLERFVNELLPVVDSMELGLDAAGQLEARLENVVEGTELTLKMLLAALSKFEVAQIDPKDAPFNPELHQAMSMQTVEGVAPGTVVQVVQKGYTLNGRLVRPAMVIVAN